MELMEQLRESPCGGSPENEKLVQWSWSGCVSDQVKLVGDVESFTSFILGTRKWWRDFLRRKKKRCLKQIGSLAVCGDWQRGEWRKRSPGKDRWGTPGVEYLKRRWTWGLWKQRWQVLVRQELSQSQVCTTESKGDVILCLFRENWRLMCLVNKLWRTGEL